MKVKEPLPFLWMFETDDPPADWATRSYVTLNASPMFGHAAGQLFIESFSWSIQDNDRYLAVATITRRPAIQDDMKRDFNAEIYGTADWWEYVKTQKEPQTTQPTRHTRTA